MTACENCKFAEPRDDEYVLCRRHAPRAAEGQGGWPWVKLTDWCGEFKIYRAVAIEDLRLSVRTRRALLRLGVDTVEGLAEKSESELMSIKNFGETSLREVRSGLKLLGLTLKGESLARR